jgi:hypothetical protein
LNLPVPPLEQFIDIGLCFVIGVIIVLKKVHDKIVKWGVVKASMLLLPIPCAVQCEDELKSWMSENTKKKRKTRRCTWVAVYAIDRGVTWPFRPSVVATSRRLEVMSDSEMVSFTAEDGDVNIWRNAWNLPLGTHVDIETGHWHAGGVGLSESHLLDNRVLLAHAHTDNEERSFLWSCGLEQHFEALHIHYIWDLDQRMSSAHE